jgi:uncharacterized protein (DUF433 family)
MIAALGRGCQGTVRSREIVMKAEIIQCGRGPTIAGTRISVYTILQYADWHHTALAALLNLSSDQVNVARKYIEQHREEVMAENEKILARVRRGNPPEIRAKLIISRAKLRAELERRRLYIP